MRCQNQFQLTNKNLMRGNIQQWIRTYRQNLNYIPYRFRFNAFAVNASYSPSSIHSQMQYLQIQQQHVSSDFKSRSEVHRKQTHRNKRMNKRSAYFYPPLQHQKHDVNSKLHIINKKSSTRNQKLQNRQASCKNQKQQKLLQNRKGNNPTYYQPRAQRFSQIRQSTKYLTKQYSDNPSPRKKHNQVGKKIVCTNGANNYCSFQSQIQQQIKSELQKKRLKEIDLETINFNENRAPNYVSFNQSTEIKNLNELSINEITKDNQITDQSIQIDIANLLQQKKALKLHQKDVKKKQRAKIAKQKNIIENDYQDGQICADSDQSLDLSLIQLITFQNNRAKSSEAKQSQKDRIKHFQCINQINSRYRRNPEQFQNISNANKQNKSKKQANISLNQIQMTKQFKTDFDYNCGSINKSQNGQIKQRIMVTSPIEFDKQDVRKQTQTLKTLQQEQMIQYRRRKLLKRSNYRTQKPNTLIQLQNKNDAEHVLLDQEYSNSQIQYSNLMQKDIQYQAIQQTKEKLKNIFRNTQKISQNYKKQLLQNSLIKNSYIDDLQEKSLPAKYQNDQIKNNHAAKTAGEKVQLAQQLRSIQKHQKLRSQPKYNSQFNNSVLNNEQKKEARNSKLAYQLNSYSRKPIKKNPFIHIDKKINNLRVKDGIKKNTEQEFKNYCYIQGGQDKNIAYDKLDKVKNKKDIYLLQAQQYLQREDNCLNRTKTQSVDQNESKNSKIVVNSYQIEQDKRQGSIKLCMNQIQKIKRTSQRQGREGSDQRDRRGCDKEHIIYNKLPQIMEHHQRSEGSLDYCSGQQQIVSYLNGKRVSQKQMRDIYRFLNRHRSILFGQQINYIQSLLKRFHFTEDQRQ